jgi:hypothetical protein
MDNYQVNTLITTQANIDNLVQRSKTEGPSYKTSQIQKVPNTKHPKPHNVPTFWDWDVL